MLSRQHTFSELSHNNSIRNVLSEHCDHTIFTTIIKLINKNQYAQAYHQCTKNNLLNFVNIIRICYQHHLINYIINSSDKILRIKQETYLMTNEGMQRLAKLMKYRQYSVQARNNYEQICRNIKSLTTASHFVTTISSINPELKQIKHSFLEVFSQIKKMKQKVMINGMKSQSNQSETDLKQLLVKLTKRLNSAVNIEEIRKKQTSLLSQQFIEMLEMTMNSYQEQIQQLKIKLQQQNNRNETLTQTMLESNEEYEEARKQYLQLCTRMEQMEAKSNAFEMENNNFHKQKQKSQVQLTSLAQIEQELKTAVFEKEQYKEIVANSIKQKEKAKEKIFALQSKIKRIQKVNEEQCQMIKDLNIKVNEQNESLHNMTIESASVNKLQTSMIQSYDLLEQQYKQLKQKLRTHPISFEKHSNKSSKLINNLKLDMEMTQLEVKRLKQELQKEKEDKYQIQQCIQGLKTQILELALKNEEYEEFIHNLSNKKEQLKQQITEISERNKYIQDQLMMIESEKQYYRLKLQSIQLQKQINKSKQKGINTIVTLQDLTNIQINIIEQQRNIQNHEKQIYQLQQKFQSQKLFLQKQKEQIEQKYQSLKVDINLSQVQRKNSFFVGRIINQNEHHLTYLLNIIQNLMQKQIRKTDLLYRYDPLNKVSVHKYIDNCPNFVMLLKLQNGWICGGFSEGSLIPKTVSDKNGLIFSLSAQQSFQLKTKNKKAICYDDFFIIFGNSQLRVKIPQVKLFSNFGIASSFYDAKQFKVDVITGQEGVREIDFLDIQIFQLHFY